MSDTHTDNSSENISDQSSVISSNSLFDEIEELVEKFQDLNTHIHNSFETLENIYKLVINHKNITITYNGNTSDLDDILEELHSQALINIKDNKPVNFSESIFKILDIAEIH